MIFLRIGWMTRYQGLKVGDTIVGGGAFVAKHGYGHEIFNFRPFNGRVYGYVQPPGRTAFNGQPGPGIDIDRLGAKHGDDSVFGVLALWVARPPQGGSVIVGWYKNATVYRHWQKPPAGAERTHAGEEFGYYATAASEDATLLLPPDSRVFTVPRGKGGMGQANVWYADDAETHTKLREQVQEYVATRKPPKSQTVPAPMRQPDPFLRQQVERAAITETDRYYTGLGYIVDSVEKDNCGWDLDAAHPIHKVVLKLEVKGLSGGETCVDVTPNEYARMTEHRSTYRLCIVTDALRTPELAIFAYSAESQRWEDQRGRVLDIQPIIAARCRAAAT